MICFLKNLQKYCFSFYFCCFVFLKIMIIVCSNKFSHFNSEAFLQDIYLFIYFCLFFSFYSLRTRERDIYYDLSYLSLIFFFFYISYNNLYFYSIRKEKQFCYVNSLFCLYVFNLYFNTEQI